MTRPKRLKKTYSDAEKAAGIAAMALNGGNSRAASRQLAAAGVSVSPSTLRGWAAQPMELGPVVSELAEDAKRRLDQILESIAQQIFRGLNRPEAIARILTKPVQAMTVGAIAVDKMRLVREQATEIIGTTEWGRLMQEIRDSRQAARTDAPVTAQEVARVN